MITRVEISGFKTFTDFAVDLAPLSVIAGANASGKSNFLDALQLLRELTAGKSLGVGVKHRGLLQDLFTKYDQTDSAKRIVLAVELLIPMADTGKEPTQSTRFRYELAITAYKDEEGPYYGISHEKLLHLSEAEDHWSRQYIKEELREKFLRYYPKANKVVFDYPGSSFNKETGEFTYGMVSDHPWNSHLGITSHSSNKHIAAVRNTIVNIFPIDLIAAGNFSNYKDLETNDSIVLQETIRLAKKHPEIFHRLSLRVGQVAKNIRDVTAEVDEFGRLSVIATNQDGTRFLSNSLSEGTLRVIALCILLYCENPQRTYLFEELENGIDPRVLTKVAELLLDIVADFQGNDIPLNQIICTTHSPALIDYLVNEIDARHATTYLSSIANVPVASEEGKRLIVATRIRPIVKDITAPVAESRAERTTLHEAKAYMRYGRPESLVDA